MAVTISYDGTVPTVGADADLWGGIINTALGEIKDDLDDLATLANATETAASNAASAASAAQTTANNAAPAGMVAPFFRSSAPTGWLKCNGAAVSRTTYSALWVAMGSPNTGDGSTTFTLPDLRAEFIRGLDDSRGVDSGRTLGSAQSQSIQSHRHSLPAYSNADSGVNVEDAGFSGGLQSSFTGFEGGDETRPRNVALLYCIKT